MDIKNSVLKRMKGQITIFLALVFMVIFSIFGMTISMGMFVHDKINLQNSTDLASYYVATKQAEMLTAIAHSNYQIRQSWKLAVFRYRVISSGSRTNAAYRHPGIGVDAPNFINTHDEYKPAAGDFSGGSIRPPRVCIAATHIFRDFENDNLCKNINFTVSYVPTVPVIIPIGIIGVTNTTIIDTNATMYEKCSGATYMNWWFANTIVGAHKMEQRDRRAVIEALALNMAKPIESGGMKDLDGKDVYDGAWKTFLYNLSESNRESMDTNAKLTIKNSMEGLAPADWLAPIYVNISLPISVFTAASGCTEVLAHHMDDTAVQDYISGSNPTYINSLQAVLDADGRMKDFGNVANYPDDLYNMTVGVEKNPWYMVYNKASSNVESRPLFMSDIFGTGIKIKSVAYSKPFGGRVGPWYNTLWPSGSPTSSGSDKTDETLPVRVERADLGSASLPFDKTLFPNYARAPGDKIGMTTKAAMVAAGKIIGWKYIAPPLPTVKSRITDYVKATYSYFTEEANDPLAQDATSGAGTPWDSFNRRMEIAAIAPDVFDMLHYTIVPGFYDYFVKDRLEKSWFTNTLPPDVEVRGDIGSHRDGPPETIKNFDIIDQMKIGVESGTKDGIPRPRTAAWLDNPNLRAYLSSWIPGAEIMNYDAADASGVKERFAACGVNIPEGRVKIPSECLKGGRSGYSVKIISKKYLESEDHPIDGGGGTGAILNVL